MTTATLDKTAYKTRRAALQKRIKDRAKFEEAKNRAAEELSMAQQLVNTHQRTVGYLVAFETAFQHAATAFNDLNNVIPNELVNTCQDRSLKDDLEVAVSIRSQLIAEHQHSRNAVKRAEHDLESTKTRITLQRGEPAIVKDGEPLPWEAGFIQRAFSALQISLGHVTTPTWAISEDKQSIAFAPGVHPKDVTFYSEQWFEDLRTLRMAKAANESTEKRLKDAETALRAVKDKMVWSPI